MGAVRPSAGDHTKTVPREGLLFAAEACWSGVVVGGGGRRGRETVPAGSAGSRGCFGTLGTAVDMEVDIQRSSGLRFIVNRFEVL